MGLLNKKREKIEAGELLFCQEASGERLLNRLCEIAGAEPPALGNVLAVTRGGAEITLTAFGSEDEGEPGVYAKRQISGVCGYFRQVEAKSLEIQRNLLFALKRCQGVVQLHYSFGAKSEKADQERFYAAQELFQELARELDGLMTQGGDAIAGGDGQIILDSRGESEVKYFLPSEEPLPESWQREIPKKALKRRERSNRILRKRRLYVPSWLPVLKTEGETSFPTVRQVCGRAGALLTVSLYSECLLGEHMEVEEAREFVSEIADHFQAWEFLSPSEKAYLTDDYSREETRIQFVWQYENLYVMEWALGFFEKLSWPSAICDVGECVRKIREFDSLEELCQAAKLRSETELLDKADLTYRLDWACVDARVNGFPAPGGLDGGVIMERHRALFWLTGCGLPEKAEGEEGPGEDGSLGWDHVDLST